MLLAVFSYEKICVFRAEQSPAPTGLVCTYSVGADLCVRPFYGFVRMKLFSGFFVYKKKAGPFSLYNIKAVPKSKPIQE